MTNHYIKKYRVRKVSEYLYSLLEHVEGGLYIAHNPMPFSEVLRALTTINKHSQTHYNLVVCDDLDLVCEQGNCDKPSNSFTQIQAPYTVDMIDSYVFCVCCGLEYIGYMNWRFSTHKNNGVK
jgi:hypothetical protein